MRLFSALKNNGSSLIKADTWEDIPTPKPNEAMFVPFTNHLWNPRISVFANNTKSPEWYEDLERKDMGLRRCSGLSDYLRIGYTIPMWATVNIRQPINKLNQRWEASFNVADYEFMAETVSEAMIFRHFSKEVLTDNQFAYHQVGLCPVQNVRERKNADFIKLINPWLIKTAPGYSCLFIGRAWEPSRDFHVMAGVVNTDYYHHANIVLNVIGSSSFSITEGTPLVHVIPFKREDTIKTTQLLRGDENIHKLLDQLGFDGAFRYLDDMGGKYKAEQNKVDTKLRNREVHG
jgi:hypothetical protein